MTLSCPHCRQPLVVSERGANRISACKHCGGVWLDAAAAHRIATTLDPQLTSLADAASSMAETPSPALSPRPSCPECEQPLTRYRVESAAVDVDFCATHGTWFDRDELQTVARALTATRKLPPPTVPTLQPTRVPQTTGTSDDWRSPGGSGSSVAGDIAGGIVLGGAEFAIEALFSFL